MGVESARSEAATYGPKRFPYLTDQFYRPSQGLFTELLKVKEPTFRAGVNRMGPYDFGSPMDAKEVDRSMTEGSHSTSQIHSGNFRSDEASSVSSSDLGYLNRIISVSELLAFRNRDGKVIAKQTPTGSKNLVPATSSISAVSLSCGGTTINRPTHAAYRSISNSLPKVVNNDLSFVPDGREFSAAISNDSDHATSSFTALATGLKTSTSASSSIPFVFSASASNKGPLKPGIQTNVPSGLQFSGSCRPSVQSNIPTDGLFWGVFKPGVQPNVSVDSSFSGSMRPASHTSLSSENSWLSSSEPTVQSNIFKDNLLSVPIWPAAQVSSTTEPSYMGSSKSVSKSEVAFETQCGGLFEPTGQSDVPFQLLAANTAEGAIGGMSRSTVGDKSGDDDLSVSMDTSRKLKQLDAETGMNLFPSFGKLDLNKDGERAANSLAFAANIEVEQSLKKLDIDKGNSLSQKMEKLVINKDGKCGLPGENTFVSGGQSTSASGVWTPCTATFVFGAAKARAGNISERSDNQRSQAPPVPSFSSAFTFGAAWEVKPLVSKTKKDKLRHRPLRPGLRINVKGKNSASVSSIRSEVLNPHSSNDGALIDISPQNTSDPSTSSQLGHQVSIKLVVPELNERGIDEERGGASDVDSMNELGISILRFRAAVCEVNFGPGYNQTKQSCCSTAFSYVMNQDSSLYGNKNGEEALSSTGHVQEYKRPLVAGTCSVERAEPKNNLAEQACALAEKENDLAQHVDNINEMNEKSDVSWGYCKHPGAGSNEDGTEATSGPEVSNCNDGGKPRAESEGKGCSFTFTARTKARSTSNLRRRTRKVLRSVGKVLPSDKTPVPALDTDRSNSRPMSAMTSGTWSDNTSLGGPGGSVCQEGVNAQGVVGGAAANEQACERWRLRGNQAYAKGDFVKAEEFYSLGAGSVSPDETSESCIRASMLCYSNRAATRMVVGRMREALADCMHAMEVDPSFIRVHLRAAGCHLALGETELAASAFKECLKQAQAASKVDPKVLADASDGLKKAQQVAEYLTQARELVHSNSLGDSVTALRLLDEALLASPQSEWLLELKACSLISLQRYTEAIQVCQQSLPVAERNLSTLEGASIRFKSSHLGWRRRVTVKANFHLGKLEKALEQLEQVQDEPFYLFSSEADLPGAFSAEMPLHSIALVRDLLRHKVEGNKAFQAGKFAEALEHYTAALARNGDSRPFCAVCLCNRAAASQALGHIADSIADCSRAIALDPLYVKAISRRASLHEKVRDYGQSCCDLGRLIAIYERQFSQVQGMRSLMIDGATRPSVEDLQQAKERLMKAEVELKKGLPLDHYGILGLEPGCSASDIKKAYRKAALRHHPDKAGQFLLRSGDTVDDLVKDAMDETGRKDGERLIDEIRKDSEQLFKLIGVAYAVLSDPAKRSRYDSDEDLRKLRTRSSDLAKNVNINKSHSRTSDGAHVNNTKGGWSSCNSAGESENQSRASRQRERWEGFNYQYQRWHPGPDAAQPDVYARRGRPTGSTFGSFHRNTSWRWEEYPWDDV